MSLEFTADRLAFARSRAGKTRASLAKEVAISPRMLAHYEAGDHVPSEEMIDKLSKALGVPGAFFAAPPIAEVGAGDVHFRALSKMSAIKRDAALASGSLAIELSAWLDERMHLPAPLVPVYDRGASAPETSARRLRLEWDMGYAKIRNVVHLVEAHGVRVFSLPSHLADVDAFSFWWKGTPYMLLNTRKSAERGRFDVAHELGHLVMHGAYDVPTGREREWEANRFAAAFLMPEDAVLASGLRNPSLETILAAKKRWGVSAMALTHRLHELGVITDWTYTSTCRRLSQMGYRSGEPDPDPAPRESSQVLDKAFALLRDRGITASTIARDLAVHSESVRELVFGLVLTSIDGGRTGDSQSRQPTLRLVD